MNIRWWRVAIIYEESGDPWTWTFHVRAFTEKRAIELAGKRAARTDFTVYTCHPSDPLPSAVQEEAVVAAYGPYHRSWADRTLPRTGRLFAEQERADREGV
ncbi:MAG: hypothetical protein ACYTGZ_05665 [Planctomycetota bacterium]|jgi:hypothetical protein